MLDFKVGLFCFFVLSWFQVVFLLKEIINLLESNYCERHLCLLKRNQPQKFIGIFLQIVNKYLVYISVALSVKQSFLQVLPLIIRNKLEILKVHIFHSDLIHNFITVLHLPGSRKRQLEQHQVSSNRTDRAGRPQVSLLADRVSNRHQILLLERGIKCIK